MGLDRDLDVLLENERMHEAFQVVSCVVERGLTDIVSMAMKRHEISSLSLMVGYACALSKKFGIPMNYVIEYALSALLHEESFLRELESIPKVVEHVRNKYGVNECEHVYRLAWSDPVDYKLHCTDRDGRHVDVYVEVSRGIKSVDKIGKALSALSRARDPYAERVVFVLFNSSSKEVEYDTEIGSGEA